MIFVDIDADITEPNQAVLRLERSLSPQSIATFLASSAHAFLQQRVDDRFSNEGDDATGPWEQLRRSTAGIRKAQGFGPYHPINVRSGDLREFTRNTFYINHGASPTLVMPGKAPTRLLADKFRTAQKGGGKSKVSSSRAVGPNMPAPPRPVIGLAATDQAALTKLLEQHVLGRP